MWQYTGQLVANACSRPLVNMPVNETPVRQVGSGEPSLVEVSVSFYLFVSKEVLLLPL